MVMYLPELRTTRRIVGTALAGSMFGTGFSYEDFAQMQGLLNERELKRLADDEYEQRSSYVVELQPSNPESSYSRIVTHVDQAWCIPMASYFHDREGTMVKELVVETSSVRQIDQRWIPYEMTMRDHTSGTHTEITVVKAEVDPKLRDLMFTAGGLEKGR